MAIPKYKIILDLAEKEKGVTPGAYCHRGAAIRALEMLQELASKDASEAVAKVINEANEKIKQAQKQIQKHQATIQRQAEALTKLQTPPKECPIPMGKGILSQTYSKENALGSHIDNPSLAQQRLLKQEKDRWLLEQYQRQKERERFPPQYFPERKKPNPFKDRMDDYFRDAKDIFDIR